VWFFLLGFCASPLLTQLASFAISDCNFENLGAYNIFLERSSKYLSNVILHTPKFQKLQSKIAKKVDCAYSGLAQKHGKKNCT